MTFREDLERFKKTLADRQAAVFEGTAEAMHGSVVEGSPLTGAPGQPVDWGYLKGSWQPARPDPWVAETTTNADYAPAIEEGQQDPYTREDGTEVTPGPMTLRSEVGGFHSVKLTRANFQALVDDVVDKVVPK